MELCYACLINKKNYGGKLREEKLAIIHTTLVRLINKNQNNLGLNSQKIKWQMQCSTMIKIGLKYM